MKSKLWKTLLPLLAVLVVFSLVAVGAFHRLDRWSQDALCQQRGSTTREIVVIGIDEDTLTEFGPYGPSYRNIMAYALQALAADPEHLPAAVALDVLYEGVSGTAGDDKLAEAAANLGCVITATAADYGDDITWEGNHAKTINASAVKNYIEPYEALRDVTVQGHISIMPDKDGILRHAILYVKNLKGESVYSLAVQAAQMYADKKGISITLPTVNGAGHYYVPYTGLPGDYYDKLSISRLLRGKIPSEIWADKIVLIGPYATALQDSFFTSISHSEPMYGIEYHANIIQSLLSGNLKTEAPDWIQLLVLAVLCLPASWVFFHRKVWIASVVCAALIILGLGSSYLFYRAGWVLHVLWIPVSALLLYLMGMTYHFVLTSRERRALELEKARISTELSLATRIQASFLPKAFPDRPEFHLFASMTPAKEVGGDLYDFFQIDEDHLCLVIGDVSGKGVPASLFMMLASALIHYVAKREISPAKILTQVNAEICARNPEEMFVTVWLAVLELSTGILTAANAGHEYPAVKHPDGSFELLKDKHGLVIGGMEGIRYREYTLQLEPGSRVFVYTDGVAEATDANNQLYGTDRMIEALREKENGAPEEILASVNRSVDAFVGKAPQFDDLTMLCIEYKGPASPPDSQPSI